MTIRNAIERMASLLLLVPGIAKGLDMKAKPNYRVRSLVGKRDLQTTHFNPLDMMLSFSDDGADKEDEFYLDIFDTPALLTNAETPMVISDAMNSFLIAELNGRFDHLNSVEKVSSEIFNLSERNGTYVDSLGLKDTRLGTEARMKVTLSFELTPSPKTDDVIDILKEIMSNLTYFVTNLTGSVSDDNELSGAYEAIRREIRPPSFAKPPDQTIVVDISEGEGQVQNGGKIFDDSSQKFVLSTVPIVVVVAVLAAVIVLFVFKKRRKAVEPESDKDSGIMHMDVENDVYSIDRSVGSETSKSAISMLDSIKQDESSIQFSMSNESGLLPGTQGGDSVFSGIDTTLTGGGVLSPRSLSSPKSMMTGYTCGSGSTIRASNLNSAKNKKKLVKPKSPAGASVFAFLDPIEDADEDDVDDLVLMERAQISTKSNGSQQDTNENSNLGNTGGSTDGTESSSSLEGVSISLPVNSKKENQENDRTKAPSAEPVYRVLADLENMEATIASVPREPKPFNMQHMAEARDAQAPTPRNSGAPTLPLEDEKKSETDDLEKTVIRVATGASNQISGFFKGERKSMSTPTSPVSSPTIGGPLSAPTSPVSQVGRHWITSPNKTPLRIPRSPKLEDNDDYVMDLSNPSLTEENYNDARGVNDTISDSMRIIDRAPQDSPDLEPHGGRRHVGDNVVDGSALYQASAMHPTDWSCKSSDADSIGASTIDEETSQIHKNLLSLGGDDGDATNNIVMDSTRSISASRQLINDLVWLEKKIATVRGENSTHGASSHGRKRDDSLSFDSNDKYDGIEVDTSIGDSQFDRNPSNIVCRDCFAPPGKLHIVIHSTKDGPEVHMVRDQSTLEGEIFPGDLIIAVDNVDTRTCTAEEVLGMMSSKGDQERKITVLRFKDEA